jgi:predicted permease
MPAFTRFVAALRALVRARHVEQDLDEELHAYLDLAIDDKIRAGMTRDAAVRAAKVEIGSLQSVKDRTRAVGWDFVVESVWRDLRYGARTLRKSPTFSIVATATLALGIGANTAIFSVVNAILLRPLPVDHPEQLIEVAAVTADRADPVFSYAAYRHFALDGAAVAEAFAASNARREAIAFDGVSEPVAIKLVSGNYFTALGVRPALGRMLTAADDRRPLGEPVAVLSDAFWAGRFGRDPSIVGRRFRFKAAPFTVIGVAPRGFFGETVGDAPDVWIPLTAEPGTPPFVWAGHSTTWLTVLARRRPGVTLAQARAGLEPVYAVIRDEIAGGMNNPRFREGVLTSRLAVSDARGGVSKLRNPFSTPLLILMGMVLLVLVIACANVASLMLARAAIRRRETAVCLAFGASRVRLVGQWFAEASLLALCGGLGGLALAAWGSRSLVGLVAGALPISLDVAPDRRVFAFAALVSCATAVVFALAPALGAPRVDLLATLKASGGPGRGAPRVRLRRTFVVTQIAVSLVLLVAAALFVRSLLNLQDIDAGFDPKRVLVFEMMPPVDERPVPIDEARRAYQRLLARAEAVPGVSAASVAFSPLFTMGTWGNAVTVEGFVPPPAVTPRTFANAVGPRYFDVMRIPIRRGRAFLDTDGDGAPRVAIVSGAFARQFFGDADPIGRRVAFGSPPKTWMEVVGLAGDAKYVDLRERERPMLYVPFTQHAQTPHEVEVRTAGDPAAVAATLRRELASVDSRLAIVGMTTLGERVDASIVPERLIARLSAVFGLLALLLAAVGLYGLVAYMTTQRTSEIGIRMALGADRAAVRWFVLRETFVLVAIGLAIGLPIALAGARLLARQLYDVAPADPLAMTIGVATLSCAALLAGFLPAQRASRVDPLMALRAE